MSDAPPLEKLDAAADGAFSGKLADPADTLTKRGGKGHVVYEGTAYDRLAWTRRCAERGYTLAAGEGALLLAALIEAEQERDALRDQWSGLLIEQARLMALRDDAVAERDALRAVYQAAAVYCNDRTVMHEHALIDAVGAVAVQP